MLLLASFHQTMLALKLIHENLVLFKVLFSFTNENISLFFSLSTIIFMKSFSVFDKKRLNKALSASFNLQSSIQLYLRFLSFLQLSLCTYQLIKSIELHEFLGLPLQYKYVLPLKHHGIYHVFHCP